MSLSLNSMWDPCKQGYKKSYMMSKYFFLDSPFLVFLPFVLCCPGERDLESKGCSGLKTGGARCKRAVNILSEISQMLSQNS
jgi:hypothetical protein